MVPKYRSRKVTKTKIHKKKTSMLGMVRIYRKNKQTRQVIYHEVIKSLTMVMLPFPAFSFLSTTFYPPPPIPCSPSTLELPVMHFRISLNVVASRKRQTWRLLLCLVILTTVIEEQGMQETSFGCPTSQHMFFAFPRVLAEHVCSEH